MVTTYRPISHYTTPYPSSTSSLSLQTLRGRGKNIAFSIYLHKCSKIIDHALSWVSPNSRNTSFSNTDHLFVWQDFGFKRVATNTITHLQASRSYCEIHLTDAPKMTVSVPMSEVGKHLPPNNFIRIHRSYIVSIRHVDALVGNMVVMDGGHKLPISKEYRSIMLGYFCFVGSKSQKFIL